VYAELKMQSDVTRLYGCGDLLVLAFVAVTGIELGKQLRP